MVEDWWKQRAFKLDKDISHLEALLENAKRELKESDRNVSALLTLNRELREPKGYFEARIERLRSENDHLRAKLNSGTNPAEARIQQLESDLADHKRVIQKLYDALGSSQVIWPQTLASARIKYLEEDNKRLKDENRLYRRLYRDLETGLQTAKDENIELSEKLLEAEKYIQGSVIGDLKVGHNE